MEVDSIDSGKGPGEGSLSSYPDYNTPSFLKTSVESTEVMGWKLIP